MRVRYRMLPVLAAVLAVSTALLASIVPASAATGTSSPTDVAYQISASHDGFSSDTTISPPLSSRWTHTFAGPVSYPLIADGKVFVTVADNGGNYGPRPPRSPGRPVSS
jgi:hypothetical protein